MLKQTFVALVALLVALLVSSFESTNSSPVRILPGHSSEHSISNGNPLAEINLNTQDSDDEDLCTICMKNNYSNECYFHCEKTATNHPSGHLYCEDCVLEVAKTTQDCPMCSEPKDDRKIYKLWIDKSEKDWEKKFQLIQRSGITIPQKIDPSGVKIPVNHDDNLVKDLIQLVSDGIPLPDSDNIQNRVRNIIHAIKLLKINDEKMIIDFINKCVAYSNDHILSEIFKELVQPDQKPALVIEAIRSSILQSSLPILSYIFHRLVQPDQKSALYIKAIELSILIGPNPHILYEILKRMIPSNQLYDMLIKAIELSIIHSKGDLLLRILERNIIPHKTFEFLIKAVDYSYTIKQTTLLIDLVPKFKSKEYFSKVVDHCIKKALDGETFKDLFKIIIHSFPDKHDTYYKSASFLSYIHYIELTRPIHKDQFDENTYTLFMNRI